jgi:predicted MFS family arabinose efflux permease
MPEISGYRVLFGVAIVSVLVQLVVISRFHPIEQLRHRSELRLALKLLFRKAEYKLMLAYDFFRGIRDGTFAFILNMLLFEIITDESVVGINTFLTGIMAITGSWAYGKLVGPGRRIRYSLICVTALMVFCGALYWNMSAAVVMTFTVANAFLQLFLLYSYNNTTYDVISRNQLARKCSAEMFAIREAPIMLGRVLGLWLTTQVPPTGRAMWL